MARKDNDSTEAGNGHRDLLTGLILLVLAMLLLGAEVSHDRNDLQFNVVPANQSMHNWFGLIGAHLAHKCFFTFGGAAYLLPLLFGLFGTAAIVGWPRHFLERRIASILWALALVLSVCGLLHMTFSWAGMQHFRVFIGAPGPGGWAGMTLWQYGFWVLNPAGAVMVYLAMAFLSTLFLTDFHLATLVKDWWVRRQETRSGLTPEELDLERKSRDLEKKRRALEEEVEKSAKAGADKSSEKSPEPSKVGLGVDGQPVPEPTVRDLSVPQPRPGGRSKKQPPVEVSDAAKDEPVLEGEVITAQEVRAATSGDILGKAAAALAKDKTGEEDGKKGAGPEPLADTDKPDKADKMDRAEQAEKAAVSAPASETKPPAPEPKVLDRSGARPARKNKPLAVSVPPIIGNYQLPSIELMSLPDTTAKPTETREELLANAALMQQTLAQFEITVTPGDITKGPTITRYELYPAPGVKLERIVALTNNLAAALKAERIHILAPVPGKASVGIEVPNAVKTKVVMRDLLESDEWKNSKARIPLALGKDVYGRPVIPDLAEMPHLLIAGSTGSGKSVCINSIIASLLYKFSPDQLRFVMIDPKVVELQIYNALPHLVVPVVTDPKKVVLALRWVINEMEKRYQIFAKVGVRNVKSFNERPRNKPIPKSEPELPLMAKKEKVEAGADGFAVEVDEEIVVPRDEDIVIPDKLSYIVVIIDELADLMLVAPADVEMAIARITQMARAAGIHCIVATQRPSVDVITGVIKANIPARIAFQVASRVDSRTILDAMGADKLLGKGDMLYLPPGSARLNRSQGALITDQEIQNIVDCIAKQGKPSYEMEIHTQLQKPAASEVEESGCDEDEELIEQCIEVIRSEQKASVSLLQRRLRLGYTRAARIMDELEGRGIVGPSKGAEPRDILIDLDGEGGDGSTAKSDDLASQGGRVERPE
jgi:S-DNA-T family DNA segregation ATPase FtsK/SpoIIIE